jgi:hypothetical protein
MELLEVLEVAGVAVLPHLKLAVPVIPQIHHHHKEIMAQRLLLEDLVVAVAVRGVLVAHPTLMMVGQVPLLQFLDHPLHILPEVVRITPLQVWCRQQRLITPEMVGIAGGILMAV